MSLNLPLDRVNWKTSIFLMSTTLIALTAVPVYLWYNGLNTFQVSLFLFYFAATGFSITLGYHRLFSHLAFKAEWPVKLVTLVFGAAAFQNSAIDWVSDHRKHHKHVDHDDDPYDISQGFFHAHIGWLLFKLRPEPPLDNVADLQGDALVIWQHKWCHLIGFQFRVRAARRARLDLRRTHPGARRLPHRRRGPAGFRPADDLLHQFPLPHHRPSALFQQLQCPRQRRSWLFSRSARDTTTTTTSFSTTTATA